MTDYRAEQKDEIEAIESIYSEEISIISDNPHRSWQISVDDNCALFKITLLTGLPSQ